MAPITRRRFIQQSAFTAAALYAYPASVLAAGPGKLRGRKENAPAPDPAAIRKLASKIAGHVLTPDSSDYEATRQVNNHAYDRHPAVIVRCAKPSDVARALEFGQSHGLPLAVRCGGHSAAGFGVCDGGVVLDLAGMKRVEVDADKRLARVQAGTLAGEVDQATQRFGLATTLGGCPTVGIGGLTLGGGMGTLMPKYGAACDNVRSAQGVGGRPAG